MKFDICNLIPEISNGFYFKCKMCGRCCKGKDEGYVFLFKDDIKKISNFLNISLEKFLENYVEVIESTFRLFNPKLLKYKNKIFILKALVLKQNEETGVCIFLDNNNKCQIYEYRPHQCKTWPTWYNNLVKLEHFKNSKNKCIGFNINEFDIDEEEKEKYFISKEKIYQTIKEEMEIEVEYIKRMKKYNQDFKKVFPYLKNVNYSFKIKYYNTNKK